MTAPIESRLSPLPVDALRKAFQEASPVQYVCIDDFLRPEFAAAVADAYPRFEDARSIGREFKAVNELRKVQVTDPARFPEPVRELHEILSSDAWLRIVEEITGIEGLLADPSLSGGGMHLYGPGSHLDVHVDFNQIPERGLYRRLNILVFLNRDWRPEWGGEFELWDEAVKTRLGAFAPVMSRCVIFRTSETSFHGVPKVRCPDGRSRNSYAAYYYTELARSEHIAPPHSTVFRARPDERMKGMVWMPLERLARRSRIGRAILWRLTGH
jgi:hypothetical protein